VWPRGTDVAAEIFVDTGAWFALQVLDDRWHREAAETLQAMLTRGHMLLTTNLVVGETYTLLRRTQGHEAAFRFVETLERSPRLTQVHVDEDLEREVFALLRRYRDQAFSFVDGSSFAVMRQRRVRRALAFDAHFAAAGFARVPTDEPLG
jgi:uncharacterized protein